MRIVEAGVVVGAVGSVSFGTGLTDIGVKVFIDGIDLGHVVRADGIVEARVGGGLGVGTVDVSVGRIDD